MVLFRLRRVSRLSPVPLLFLNLLLGSCGTAVALEKPEAVLLEFLAKPFAPSDGASTQCLEDSRIYLREVAKYTPWALQMYDASVKIPSGVITGNIKQLGNYDECLRVKSGHGFAGKACNAMVNFDISQDSGKPREPDMGDIFRNIAVASDATNWTSGRTVGYEWMWCVPSSCNHTEIHEALELALDPLKVDGRVDMVITVNEDSCRTAEMDRPVFDATDWIYISILAIFAAIVIASTSYDIAKQGHLGTMNRAGTKHSLFTSFSLYTNGKYLLNTDRRRDSITCLDGLRYISICWIIYGHTNYCEVVGVKINVNEIVHMHSNWSNMLVLNGNIVTDTFFLLSGILMAYTALIKNEKDPKKRFDVIGLYLHRYLRLTPAYAMMIGFYATLFYKFGTGPYWKQWVGDNRDYCRENWWTNLLYVNNYVNLPRICLSQSWYLAADMQLVWLSPIFLYPMLKFNREIYFWLIFALGFVASVLIPFFITFSLNLTGTMLYYKDLTKVGEVYVQIYTKLYTRFGSYIVGLALGFILYKTRSRDIRIRPIFVTCGWLFAAASGLFMVVTPRWMYDEDVYNRLEASFYASLHRQIFAMAVAWVIFCCFHGYAGIIGQFLSWKGWVPLSKLTYSAYLCHYVFLLTEAGSVRTTGIITQMSLLRSFFSNLCLTMILSALWSLCFEMPFMTLDRILLSNRSSPSKLTSNSNQGKLFGSTDSSKEIYRSTEESSSNVSENCNNVYEGKSNADSVYNSAGSVSYQDQIYDSNSSQGLTIHQKDKSPFIFVIGDAEETTWSKVNNIHQNNAYRGDSNESSKKEANIDFEYLEKENATKKGGSSEVNNS